MRDWTARRTHIADRISSTLASFSTAVRVPRTGPDMTHAYYRLYGYTRADGLKSGWSRDRIVAQCNALGAPVMQGSCSEIYLEKAFDDTPWRPSDRLPVARGLGETSLMFPCHPTITDDELERMCSAIERTFEQACR